MRTGASRAFACRIGLAKALDVLEGLSMLR